MELPIFSDNLRSSAAWSVALEREREEWQQAQASPGARAQLEVRLRVEQVRHALQRAGYQIGEPLIARLANSSPDGTAMAEMEANEQVAVCLLRAARLISAWAAEPAAVLTAERLQALYRTQTGAAADAVVFRQTEARPLSPAHSPAPAALLPRLVDNAMDWFTAPSFAEIHVVEQAALVFLRLLDLQPFPAEQEQTALLAASFYTERAGLPPLIIFSDEATAARYATAIEAALRMLTQPLVEFFAESLARTIKTVLRTE